MIGLCFNYTILSGHQLGISDQIRQKLACVVTDNRYNLEKLGYSRYITMQYQLAHDSLILILLATIIQLNKMFKRKLRIFSYPSIVTLVMGAQKKGLIEIVSLRTHKITFRFFKEQKHILNYTL